MKAFLDAVLDTTRPALFLDFDGTLAPIEPRPEGVRLTPDRCHLLRRLAAKLPLAVISGRSLDDLATRIGVAGLALAGNHGLEIRTGQKVWTHPAAIRARSRLRTALGRIALGLSDIPGAFLEDKGATASIHFRVSPGGSGKKVDRLVRKSLAGLESWLEVRPGKKVREIRPRAAWDKGAAVWRIVSGLRPGTTPVYIGDDRTDEDAFRVLSGSGLTARVGGKGPTGARFRLADVEEVWAFLKALAKDREKHAPSRAAGRAITGARRLGPGSGRAR